MPTVHIFGMEIEKKKLLIGGVIIAAAVAVVVWLRSRAASAAAAQTDQSAAQPQDQSGGAMTIPAATPAQADQYQQQMAQDSLAAQGLAYQYQQGLAQQQFAAAQLLNNVNPLQQAEQSNAAFFASNPLSSATPTGVVQQKWKQYLLNGQTIWEDVSGKNRAPITEQLAEQEGVQAKGEGPYYQSKGGGFFKPLINATTGILKGIVGGVAGAEQTAAQGAFSGAGVPYIPPPSVSPNSGSPAAQPTPTYTPPFVAYPGAPGPGPLAPQAANIARAKRQPATTIHSHSYAEIA